MEQLIYSIVEWSSTAQRGLRPITQNFMNFNQPHLLSFSLLLFDGAPRADKRRERKESLPRQLNCLGAPFIVFSSFPLHQPMKLADCRSRKKKNNSLIIN